MDSPALSPELARTDSGWRSPWLQGLLLALITMLSFSPAIRAGFIWDDDQHILQNYNLLNLHGLAQIWVNPAATPQYYPLTHTTWWLEHHLWGDNPMGYHINNILIHTASALLLWRLLKRLAVPGAWLGALFFAIHPMQVETVAWIMERKNILSGFFYLAAAHQLVRFFLPARERLAGDVSPSSYGHPAHYFAAALLFACALLCKSVAATLPAAMLLVLWWKRGRSLPPLRDWLLLLPLLAMGVGSGLYTAHLERTQVGASGPEFDFSFVQRCLIAGRALCHYLERLIIPYPLMFFYPRNVPDSRALLQYLFPAAFVAMLAAAWFLRSKIGRGPLVALLFFAGTLAPALGFLNVYPMIFSFVADHFQYMACIGPLALLAAALTWVASRRPAAMRPLAALEAVAVLLFAALTFQRSITFQSQLSLYADTVAKNPGGWVSHNLMGGAYFDAGKFQESADEYAQAREAAPFALENWNGLASALRHLGRTPETIPLMEFICSHRPEWANAQNDLALAYASAGAFDKALACAQKAVQLEPDNPAWHYGLGTLLERMQNFPAATAELKEAIRLNPQWAEPYIHLGICLAVQGNAQEGVRSVEHALVLKPDSPQARSVLEQIKSHTSDTPPASLPARR